MEQEKKGVVLLALELSSCGGESIIFPKFQQLLEVDGVCHSPAVLPTEIDPLTSVD